MESSIYDPEDLNANWTAYTEVAVCIDGGIYENLGSAILIDLASHVISLSIPEEDIDILMANLVAGFDQGWREAGCCNVHVDSIINSFISSAKGLYH